MTIIPRRDFVAIKVQAQEKEKKTASGIVLTGKPANEDRQQIGEVVAVGSGIILESGQVLPLDIVPGDKVLFNKYAGTEIRTDGDEAFILLHDKDIIAIVK